MTFFWFELYTIAINIFTRIYKIIHTIIGLVAEGIYRPINNTLNVISTIHVKDRNTNENAN